MTRHSLRFATIAAAVCVVFALVSFIGCSGKKAETAKKTARETSHVNTQVAAIETAKSLKVAFDNPKMGECPVCGHPVNYECFVTIRDKRYAVCSDECADKLRNDREQYLPAAQP
jgi:transcription elongation factor Elf1